MPIYVFKCVSEDHPVERDRDFVQTIHHMPKKVIGQYPCPACGGLGKRDFESEIKSQSVIGLTPISKSTTTPGSFYNETKFAFGQDKVNPDGSVDKSQARFRDSGELKAYMNGQNDLGEPVLRDNGQPLRRKDGSIVRKGAKLFKYPKGATPSRSGMQRSRPAVPDAWTDEKGAADGMGGLRMGSPYRNPSRRSS